METRQKAVYKFLDRVNSPEDLRKLDLRELEFLCRDIREFLIEKVSASGGHLSSNLGVIELTVALHRSLQSPKDTILFDVGHQSYTHKLITGRRDGFDKLRGLGGISGYPSPDESIHDVFVAGHASAALSAGIGLARAKKLKRQAGLVVVIVGDGAFTGGMVYEAINNIDALDNLVFVLNDNTMAISKNVGALAHYFTKLRTNPHYYKVKSEVKDVLDSMPLIGTSIKKGIQSSKSTLRKGLCHSTFFEEMGLGYVGPVDGHDITELCNLFSNIRTLKKPLLIHVETIKGKGFSPAEENPGAFHGVSSFNAKRVADPDVAPKDSFSVVFGQTLAKLGEEDKTICAITAAMKYGTGLQYFKKQHDKRFFDVGIAEEHAVTFAGGLAAGGFKPVVAVYSTFIQRAYDQYIHDVMLCRRNVLFAVDRAGLVEDDGETHQGIYDVAMFTQQADIPVVCVVNYAELEYWLEYLVKDVVGPKALRYPRGAESTQLKQLVCSGKKWDVLIENEKPQAAIITYGVLFEETLNAALRLKSEAINTDVIKMTMINPIPEEMLECLLEYPLLLFAEEGIAKGGVGEHLAAKLLEKGYKGKYINRAISEINIEHAKKNELVKVAGLDADSLAQIIIQGVIDEA